MFLPFFSFSSFLPSDLLFDQNLEPEFTTKVIEKLEAADRKIVRKLGEIAFLMPENQTMPDEAADPNLTAKALTNIYAAMGKRLHGFLARDGVDSEALIGMGHGNSIFFPFVPSFSSSLI